MEPPRRAALYQRLRDAAASAPGVARAATSEVTPVSGSTWNYIVEFPDGPHLSERERIVNMNLISPDFFVTYGSWMLAGPDFEARDGPGTPPVAIVNHAFAVKYFGGANPVARRIHQLAGNSRPGGFYLRRG